MTSTWGLRPPAFRRVRVREVSRAFGRAHALFRVSTELHAGTVTAVIGPNGAGKTTLLNLLATLDRPTEGSVTFGEAAESVAHRAAIRPHIGLVAHDTMLYPELTGRENLRFTADVCGVEPAAVGTWLSRVGLEAAADAPAATYSRGMRQRLAIARALLTEPTLVLLDEPLTGLDASGRAFLTETLRELRAAERIVVMVTHHLDWGSSELDRAIVVARGRVRFDGAAPATLADLYAREAV